MIVYEMFYNMGGDETESPYSYAGTLREAREAARLSLLTILDNDDAIGDYVDVRKLTLPPATKKQVVLCLRGRGFSTKQQDVERWTIVRLPTGRVTLQHGPIPTREKEPVVSTPEQLALARDVDEYNAAVRFKIHERVASVLKWSVEETQQHSLAALRDVVWAEDPKLANDITRIIQDPRHLTLPRQ